MKPKLAVMVVLLISLMCVADDRPDWATRSFSASPEDTFRAAHVAVLQQGHNITFDDPFTLVFHVGMTAWSWGYDMVLRVVPADEGSLVTVDIRRTGGNGVSWGSGSKEVRKIFDGIAAELSLPKATNVSAPKYPAEINNELKKYLKQKNYKAFAVSAGGRFGVMTGQTTEEIATREALAYCRRYAGSKDGQTCRLIMVGDHRID